MPSSSAGLLDTHALVWWRSGADLLSTSAARTIAEAPHVLVGPISCWEIGMPVGKGRVGLDRPTADG